MHVIVADILPGAAEIAAAAAPDGPTCQKQRQDQA
jgi:hypothetical protein